jgi:hypothetical protein
MHVSGEGSLEKRLHSLTKKLHVGTLAYLNPEQDTTCSTSSHVVMLLSRVVILKMDCLRVPCPVKLAHELTGRGHFVPGSHRQGGAAMLKH